MQPERQKSWTSAVSANSAANSRRRSGPPRNGAIRAGSWRMSSKSFEFRRRFARWQEEKQRVAKATTVLRREGRRNSPRSIPENKRAENLKAKTSARAGTRGKGLPFDRSTRSTGIGSLVSSFEQGSRAHRVNRPETASGAMIESSRRQRDSRADLREGAGVALPGEPIS